MKKMLLVLGVAAAAMTSCTSDEVLEVNPTATIQFESFVNKGTRATTNVTNPDITDGVHSDGLKKFSVYGSCDGASLFTATEVEWVDKVGNTAGRWTYSDGEHTKWTGGDYYFAAYADHNEVSSSLDVVFDNSTGALTFPEYQVDDTYDLVAAWYHHDNDVLTNPTVELNFKHMLSKVYFEITHGDEEGLTMKISDITISVAPSGTCSYNGTSTVWKELTTPESKSFNGNDNVSIGETHKTDQHFVIPGQTGIKASFTATFVNGVGTTIDEVEYTNVSLDVNGGWQAGYVYKYTATIGATMPTIEFGVSVTEWDSDLNDDDNLTNDDITLQQ